MWGHACQVFAKPYVNQSIHVYWFLIHINGTIWMMNRGSKSNRKTKWKVGIWPNLFVMDKKIASIERIGPIIGDECRGVLLPRAYLICESWANTGNLAWNAVRAVNHYWFHHYIVLLTVQWWYLSAQTVLDRGYLRHWRLPTTVWALKLGRWQHRKQSCWKP